MSFYVPQAAMSLRVIWEDFGSDDSVLNKVYVLNPLLRNLEVGINAYYEADTFRCEIDYKSFPFDPRCIRSCGVTIHIEDMKQLYKGGVLNRIEETEDNTIFTGFTDEEKISFDDNRRVVTFEGRDFTSLFIDAAYTGPPVPLSRAVDKILQDFIDAQESTKGIEIVNLTGEILPTISSWASDLDEKTSVENPKRKETFWDIMNRIVRQAGLIMYIQKSQLIIDKARNLYESGKNKQFVYGINLKNLTFKRKLGRHKDFNILVRSINFKDKKIETAKIPLDSKREDLGGGVEVTLTQLDKNGKKIDPPKAAEYIHFNVKDNVSNLQLIAIGESIYEEMSRQQIDGSLKTYEMEVPEAVERDSSTGVVMKTVPFKFSGIKMGTPIEVYLSTDDLKGIGSVSSQDAKVKFLERRGYETEIARSFAKSLDKISTPFYTKAVKFNFDQDNGFEMSIEFVNFINIDKKLLG